MTGWKGVCARVEREKSQVPARSSSCSFSCSRFCSSCSSSSFNTFSFSFSCYPHDLAPQVILLHPGKQGLSVVPGGASVFPYSEQLERRLAKLLGDSTVLWFNIE